MHLTEKEVRYLPGNEAKHIVAHRNSNLKFIMIKNTSMYNVYVL